jgi:PAS domain S-box-containing protein
MAKNDDYLKNLISNPNVIMVLDSIFDGVYIVNRNREILFWNRGAESITGFKREEVVGTRCNDNILNHIDEKGKALCSEGCFIKRSIEEGIVVEGKIFPMHKNKERFPAWTKIGPIRKTAGEILGCIEVFRNISKEEDFRILQEKFNKLVKKYISTAAFKEIIYQVDANQQSNNIVKDSTILFIDIAGFTKFSKINHPQEVINLLNTVFGICERATKKMHGDIDKFIGDAVMVTFDDANDAVNAAIAILGSMHDFNKKRQKIGKEPINLHFGINSGEVIHGEIGSPERKDLTVIGDAVNIASKIEALSEPGKIYISGSTYARLKNNSGFEYKCDIEIMGHQELISVYVYSNQY